MKRISNPLLRSKSAILLLCVAAGISVITPGCKKDDKADANSDQAVSQTDVATVVSTAVTNGGVASQTEKAATTASLFLSTSNNAKATTACGYKGEGNFNYATDANVANAFSINYTYNYLLTCAADQKSYQSFTFTFDGKTTMSTAKLSMADTSSATYTVTGLADTSKTLVFNQEFNHKGNVISKDGSTASFYSVIKYKSANVTVDKATLTILSGTATVSITGTTSTGKTFSYDGTITYKGNKKATFAINGGSSFDLNWQ
ncbi:hypothetical protein [Chitinophaga sp.]|uniref:hypothetical protein n=1 Tax=Chitinophaga sp. TaxID=1869181 RepID=UPI0031E29C55